MNVELVNITPDMAKTYLLANEKNRAVKEKNLKTIADDMLSGSWVENGESIKFDVNGKLIDGQHRLMACIKANVSFKSYVVTGLPIEAFVTIDSGSKRSASDVLSISKVKNQFYVSSIIRIVLMYKKSGSLHPGQRTTVSSTEIFNEYCNTPELYNYLASHASGSRILNSGFFAIAKICFEKGIDNWFEPAMEKIKTGINLTYGDPCLCIREWKIQNSKNQNKVHIMAAYIKTINALMKNNEMKVIRFGENDSFPILAV